MTAGPDRAGPILLDGRRLARERAPGLARRADAVASERGRPPRVLLVSFEPEAGEPDYLVRKVAACQAVGVDADRLMLARSAGTDEARSRLAGALAADPADGVFLEFPFPAGVDHDALCEVLPEDVDIDVMSPGRIHAYLSEGAGLPPLTVSAALALLARYGVDVVGREGAVVARASPFAEMFREALARSGARMKPVLDPETPDLRSRTGALSLVVAAAGQPGLLRTGDLAPGAVAIDAGYFNPGGRGDIERSDGEAHLDALAPVPGAIGPMTVSMLVERVIAFAAEGQGPHGEREGAGR